MNVLQSRLIIRNTFKFLRNHIIIRSVLNKNSIVFKLWGNVTESIENITQAKYELNEMCIQYTAASE